MKSLFPITLTLFSLLLVGCEEESDQYAADGRDFDAESYVTPQPYTGRVINGYLQNARVWLDIDGDGQYTPGPLTIENAEGTELVLPSGEPTTMSGEDGRFVLDVTELEQDPLIAPDLDPRDYSLFAVALPGKTIEQTGSGEQTVEDAILMSAPPGVRNVTPLTTLARQGSANNISQFLVGSSALAQAIGNANLVSDYVRSGDERAQAYARALARFRASQLPGAYQDVLSADGSDGTERFLSEDAIKLMGISLARNALEIVELVNDAAIDGDFAGVDIESLSIPVVELELDDSVIITRQTVFARSADGLPATLFDEGALAEFQFDYAENARLTSISVNGCMIPSLAEMVRVINADGKISETGTQWIPSLSLNQKSAIFFDDPGIDERLTFDWDSGTAAFETTTNCHDGLAASSELGGPPEVEYVWEMSGGRVTSLTANSAGKTEVFRPDYRFAVTPFRGFTRTVNDTDQEVVTLDSEPQSCAEEISEFDQNRPQVVSSIQPYTLSGALDIPAGFSNLVLELDTRGDFNRPLRYPFQSERLQNTEGVNNEEGFEWKFYYPSTGSDQYVEEQPDLIDTAYVTTFDGDRDCGRDFGFRPNESYARVAYSYLKLSEYLAGRVQ